jgi:pyruvate formate lyase activating enzyme
MSPSGPSGIVFNIQRHSIHDGPGIRTILFLKGCPLSCLWCSNPESQLFTRELSFNPAKCIGCRACAGVCPTGAIRGGDDSGGGGSGSGDSDSNAPLRFERGLCVSCGACAGICYAGARSMEGREMSAEEAVEEVCRDEPFFRRSGGGLTLGGGEPLAQPEFAAAVLRGFKARGFSTAIETAGHVPWENFLQVIPHADYFLFDIKHTDPDKHKRFTGEDTRLIQENLEKLVRAHSHIIARTPVIPGFNDSGAELSAIADRAAALGLKEIDFLPYHGYGSGKYDLLGRPYPMKTLGMELPGTAQISARLEELKTTIEARGLKVQIGG